RATNQKGDFDLKTFEVRLRPEAVVKGLRPGMTVRIAF
ncbi:HlyD family secretion protein, partial [candidate division KSB1 bacterium]